MLTTPRWGFPYPESGDPADGPRAVGDLANALDGVAMDSQGTFANRPAAAKNGRYYFATDTNVLYRDNGSAWVAIPAAASVDSSFLAANAVTQAKMADGAVGTAEIIDLAVTAAKLASSSVTALKLGKQTFIQVRRNTGTVTAPDNTETVVPWDTADVETDEAWDVGTPTVVTVPRSGLYTIRASIVTDCAPPNVKAELRIKVNGVVVGRSDSGDSIDLTVARTRVLTANDQITVHYYHNKGSSHNVTPSGEFPHCTLLWHGTTT